MKKKIAKLLVVAMAAASLAGCGNKSTATAPEETTKTDTHVTETAKGDTLEAASTGDGTYTYDPDNITEHTFSLSTTATSGSSLAEITHYFADRVGELSNGKIKIDVFEGSTLGTEAQNLEALTTGTLDMAIIGVEFYVNSIPQVGALMLPYMYDDYDQVQKVLESDAGAYASKQLLDIAKVKNLGYYVMQFRNMYTTKPIYSVDDLKGMKIRVPESALYVDTFKMMGAAPTPLAFGEVYTALDTGVVQGVENTPDSALHNSWAEVAPYFNQTNHLSAPTTFSMSNKVYESLNDDEKNLLMQAGIDASHYGLENTKATDADYRAQLKEEGMEFIESDVASMSAAIDYNSYEFMKSDEAKELFDLVQKNK